MVHWQQRFRYHKMLFRNFFAKSWYVSAIVVYIFVKKKYYGENIKN